jgi:hypothetical protein
MNKKGIGSIIIVYNHYIMKTYTLNIIFGIALLLISGLSFSQVAITTDGSSPDNSAMLDVKSTTKGMLLPRLSDAVRDAMVSPAEGLIIYNTTSKNLNFFADGKWYEFTGKVCVPQPSTSNAGPDQLVPTASTTLAANTPSYGTGTWSILSGAGGSISNIHSPGSLFTGTLGVTYTLQWAIATVCNTTTDVVLISLGPTCSNGIQDGTETDIDCGGLCVTKCATGKHCLIGGDCQSGICTATLCQAPSCSDGIKNGNETDIDCGGSCAKCANGLHCLGNSDCQSGVCTATICQVPTCFDAVKNGAETDVDCGGPTCSKCADGKHCVIATDCQSGKCTNNVCVAPTCSDGVKNGAETDVDCGGPTCPKCGSGKHCLVNNDCLSGICNATLCQ